MPPTATATRRRPPAARVAAGDLSPPASPRATSPTRSKRSGEPKIAAKKGRRAAAPTFPPLPPLLRRRLLIASGVIAALLALSLTLYLQNAALKAAIAPLLDELASSAPDSADLVASLAALSARLPASLGGSAPTRRRPGVEARAAGLVPAHPVLLIPGFVTSALEMWAGPPCAGKTGFRARWWGGLGMTARLLADRACWMETMRLDVETGLDPVIMRPGGSGGGENGTHTVRVRAVAGLSGIDYFLGSAGYSIWAEVIGELGALGYTASDLTAAPYDWRLGLGGLEARDGYFTSLKATVEAMAATGVAGDGPGGGGARHPARLVILAHSWGDTVARAFFAWADAREEGWTGRHVAHYANLAGPVLGTAKALPALLSGETRDTAELGAVATLLTERAFVPRTARAALFRSWRGSYGMLPIGGAGVWGSLSGGAPDDTPAMRAAGLSFGALVTVRGLPVEGEGGGGSAPEPTPLDVDGAAGLLLDALPGAAARHVAAAAAGVGATRPPVALVARAVANGSLPMGKEEAGAVFIATAAAAGRPRACTPLDLDPLACPVIPPASAPAVSVYCIYGTGKPTERAFRYAWDAADGVPDWKMDVTASHPPPGPLEDHLPGGDDPNVARAARAIGGLDRGVAVSDGDGTVPLLSLSTMCARGWVAGGPLNPGRARVVTREVRHAPRDALAALDLRGGGQSADHVDLLGNEHVLEDIIALAAGKGGDLQDRWVSDARAIAARVVLPTDPPRQEGTV